MAVEAVVVAEAAVAEVAVVAEAPQVAAVEARKTPRAGTQ